MSGMRRVGAVLALGCLCPAFLVASPASDFAVRLAQTVWSLQQVEALVRTMPQSTAQTATPETIASYLALASENVHALTALATEKLTNEQRRVLAEGFKSVASLLRDESALAANRGLGSVGAGLSALETTCRAALEGS